MPTLIIQEGRTRKYKKSGKKTCFIFRTLIVRTTILFNNNKIRSAAVKVLHKRGDFDSLKIRYKYLSAAPRR